MSGNRQPTISVVMPAHNAEKYISDSIRSVLNQSHVDFELIVCNDGSTDETRAIVEAMVKNDSRIRFIHCAVAEGAGAARNKCIDVSEGEYTAFLDADDIWCSDKLEKQLAYINDKNAEFVFSYYWTFQESTNLKSIGKLIDSHWIGRFSYADLLWKRANLGCLTVVCKSSLIRDRRMSSIKSGQDYAFWLELLRSTEHAYCLPEATAYYRTGHSSLSANKVKKIISFFKVFRFQESHSIVRSTILCLNYLVMTVYLSIRSRIQTSKFHSLSDDDKSSSEAW